MPSRPWNRIGILALVGLVVAPPAAAAMAAPAGGANSSPATVPAAASGFSLVGHDALYSRGMNAAPALYGHYAYVGSRTDASPGHPHAGVLTVDVADPARPRVVGEIRSPNEGNVGETSRELRVWPQQKMLIVMNFTCSAFIHACADVPVTPTFKFYDVSGANAAHPRLLTTYVPPAKPHEMFLWTDPKNAGRALLYYSTPTSDVTGANLIVLDISHARDGDLRQVATFNPNRLYSAHTRQVRTVALHSVALNPAGTRAYLSYLGGGFLVADTTDLAQNRANPRVRLVTPVANRIPYTNPGLHSAVKVPGRPYALLTEEVYGDLLDFRDPKTGFVDEEGCPWGWVKVADLHNPRRPRVVGDYRIRQNEQAFCDTAAGRNPRNTTYTSYSAHNLTVLPDLAFVTWHSGGLQAISLANPAHPRQTGYFFPSPLASVATEDPALSSGINKIVMWSYPIIKAPQRWLASGSTRATRTSATRGAAGISQSPLGPGAPRSAQPTSCGESGCPGVDRIALWPRTPAPTGGGVHQHGLRHRRPSFYEALS